jgi:hypothetical protein
MALIFTVTQTNTSIPLIIENSSLLFYECIDETLLHPKTQLECPIINNSQFCNAVYISVNIGLFLG